MALFWMMVGSLTTITTGFLGKVIYQVWTERRSTKSLQTHGFFFDGMPEPLLQSIFGVPKPDEFLKDLPIHMAENARVFVFLIKSVGCDVIRDLKIKIAAGEDSGIGHFQFQVEKEIICDRLTTEEESDRWVKASWGYLNPDEYIDLYVVATGETLPAEISIEVDAEDVRITESFPMDPANLVNPIRSAFMPWGKDHFLEKYMSLVVLASNGGDPVFPKIQCESEQDA